GPTRSCRIGKFCDWSNVDTNAMVPPCQAKQPRMGHVPLAIQQQEIAGSDGEVVSMKQHFQLLGLQFGQFRPDSSRDLKIATVLREQLSPLGSHRVLRYS